MSEKYRQALPTRAVKCVSIARASTEKVALHSKYPEFNVELDRMLVLAVGPDARPIHIPSMQMLAVRRQSIVLLLTLGEMGVVDLNANVTAPRIGAFPVPLHAVQVLR